MIYYIYKLVCNDGSCLEFYVGSTSNIRNRKYQHKTKCNNSKDKEYNKKLYQIIRDNGGWYNWRMVILEEMEEETTLLQSRMREEHYRLELEATLNMRHCGIGLTKEEYIKEYQQTDKYKEYKKEYLKEYSQTENFKVSQKKYYEKNKEEILEKRRLKYLAKKEIEIIS